MNASHGGVRDYRAYAVPCCTEPGIVRSALGYVCDGCDTYTDIYVSRDEECIAISRALKDAGAQIGCGSLFARARRAGFRVERVRISRLKNVYPPKRTILDDYIAVREYGSGCKNREALERYAEILAGAGIATILLPRSERTWMLRVSCASTKSAA